MTRYAPRVLIVIASVVAENTLSKLMTTLENRLDGNVSSTVLARYGQVGHQVRKTQRVADSKIDPDLFESLTADFCQYSQARLESNHQHKIEDMGKKAKHPIWQRLTRELRAHYTQNCRGFFTYNDHKPRWNPDIWGWNEHGDFKGTTRAQISRLSSSPRFKSWYANAVMWEPVGAPQQVIVPPGSEHAEIITSAKTADALTLVDTCATAFPAISLLELDAVYEVGAGTTAVARVFQDGSYRGSYIIYDMPEMTIMQQYYLRVAAVAAISATSTLKSEHIEQFRAGVTLTQSIGEFITSLQHLSSGSKAALFYATYSFSESPVDERARFLEAMLGKITHYFIVFASKPRQTWAGATADDRWGGNFAYFRTAFKNGLFGPPDVLHFCLWPREKQGQPAGYVLAASTTEEVACPETTIFESKRLNGAQ